MIDPAEIVAWLRGRTGAHGGGFTSADDVADAIEREFVVNTSSTPAGDPIFDLQPERWAFDCNECEVDTYGGNEVRQLVIDHVKETGHTVAVRSMQFGWMRPGDQQAPVTRARDNLITTRPQKAPVPDLMTALEKSLGLVAQEDRAVMSNPFVVTTNRGCDDVECHLGCRGRKISRRAVASLKEASSLADAIVQAVAARRGDDYLEAGYGAFGNDCFNLSAPGRDSGGTIGPLPDGTVIEVEQETWPDLFRMSGIEPQAIGMPPLYDAEEFEYIDDVKDIILSAYNDKINSQ